MKIEKLLEFTLELQKPSASKTSRLSYSWSLFSSTNLLREKNDNYDEKKASRSLDFFAPVARSYDVYIRAPLSKCTGVHNY